MALSDMFHGLELFDEKVCSTSWTNPDGSAFATTHDSHDDHGQHHGDGQGDDRLAPETPQEEHQEKRKEERFDGE